MSETSRRSRVACRALAVAMVTSLVAAPALAAPAERGQASPDFRFSAPNMTFGLRAGWTFNRADSDVYDFMVEELTLEKSDFNAPTFAADLGWRLSERLDMVFGFEYSSRSTRSEYRGYTDELGIPIVQDTRLSQVPLTLSLKLYLGSRGRRVGQYAWVPADFVPYVGGGAGFTYYRLEQEGEFVDFTDDTIFESLFESHGWTVSGHAFAGVDIKLNPSLGLVLEGRYQFASDDLTGSFVGFEPIDLSGLRAMAGVNWKF